MYFLNNVGLVRRLVHALTHGAPAKQRGLLLDPGKGIVLMRVTGNCVLLSGDAGA